MRRNGISSVKPTLEFNDVEALLSRDSLSDRSSGRDIFSSISMDFSEAFWNASEILVG